MFGFVILVAVLMITLGFFFPMRVPPGRSMWRDGALAAGGAMVLIFPIVSLILGHTGWELIGGAAALIALCLGTAVGTAARSWLTPAHRRDHVRPAPPNLGG